MSQEEPKENDTCPLSMGIVYLHTNKINGKVYVGQTWANLNDRWARHKNDAFKKMGKTKFCGAIRKYGADGFEHQVIAEAATQGELDTLEKVWIILLQATDNRFGYNLDYGGSHGRHREDTKKKISFALTGRKLSEETKSKMRGREVSEETRRKISESNMGRKGTMAWVGRKHTEESKLKASASLKTFWENRKNAHTNA